MPVFEDDPHCRQVSILFAPKPSDPLICVSSQCGLSASEGDSKMQDELSDLMTRNMQLNPHGSQPPPEMYTPPTPAFDPQPTPITYITQHYHHSSHQVPPTPPEIQPSQILAAAGIDADVLFPSQLNLFKNAQPDQQLRLIELWRIAPPTYGQQMLNKNLGNWPQTTLDQEEQAAKHRWDRMSEQERQHTMNTRQNAEPYMANGYQNLPNINGMTAPTEYQQSEMSGTKDYNRAFDPLYDSRQWWEVNLGSQPMEHQYGLLEQMRSEGYGAMLREGDDTEML